MQPAALAEVAGAFRQVIRLWPGRMLARPTPPTQLRGPATAVSPPVLAVAGRVGPQPGERDLHQPLDRGLGWQAGGCRERVKAEGSQLVRGHVAPDLPGRGCAGHQVADRFTKLLLRAATCGVWCR